MNLGAYIGIDERELRHPIPRSFFVKGNGDVVRIDRRQGHQDGLDIVLQAFLPDGFYLDMSDFNL